MISQLFKWKLQVELFSLWDIILTIFSKIKNVILSEYFKYSCTIPWTTSRKRELFD